MEMFKPCMICKKNMAITSCKMCGILICNEHTKGGVCFACFPEAQRELTEKKKEALEK